MEKKQQKEKKTVEGKLKGAVKKNKMERGKERKGEKNRLPKAKPS